MSEHSWGEKPFFAARKGEIDGHGGVSEREGNTKHKDNQYPVSLLLF